MSRIYSILIIFIFSIGIYSNNTINALPAFDLSVVSFSKLKQLNDFLINNLPVNQLKKVAAKNSSAVVLIYTISNKGKDKNNFYNSAVQPRVNKKDYKYGVTNGVMVSPDGMVVTTYTGTMNSDKYIVAIDSEKHQNNESYELPVIYGSEEESDNSNTEEEDDDYSNATYKDNENSKQYDVEEENNSTQEESDSTDTESNNNKSINKYEGFNSIEEYLDKLEKEYNKEECLAKELEDNIEREELNNSENNKEKVLPTVEYNESNTATTQVKSDINEAEESDNSKEEQNKTKSSISEVEEEINNRKKTNISETKESNNSKKKSESDLISLSKELKAMSKAVKSIKNNTNSNKTNSFIRPNIKKHSKDNLNIQLDSNTYIAKLIVAIPDLNIVVLKLKCNKSEKFNYFNIANDQFFQTKKDQENRLLYSAIVIGKCKGEHYVQPSKPYNSKNKFNITKTIIGSVSYKTIKGIPTLRLYTPLTGNAVFPENHGGALLSDNGQLVGIPYVDWSIHNPNNNDLVNNRLFTIIYYDCFSNLPFGHAIPASTVKKVLMLISLKLVNTLQLHCGVTVDFLKDHQKQILKYFFKQNRSLKNTILQALQKAYGLEKYSSIDKYIDNNNLGVEITKITSGSSADKANLQLHDIILNLNTDCVTDPRTFYNLEISNIEKQVINLKILRGRKITIMEVKK